MVPWNKDKIDVQPPYWLGKFRSNETKQKISDSKRDIDYNILHGTEKANSIKEKQRIAAINARNTQQPGWRPNYNKKSIPLLLEKATELGITDLQHAENVGEYYIKELGYWVDGYSKQKNIVIEYYEKHHTRSIDYDMIRENQIKQLLNCEFYIIYEY
jgi:hypothetical protein